MRAGERGEVLGINLKLTFPGANPDVRIEPLEPLTTTVSYFLGNDRAQWHAAVPVYRGVRYVDLYPGVDLVLGEPRSFWRLEAGSGAAMGQVRIQVEGVPILDLDGAALRLDVEGEARSFILPQANFPYQATGVSGQGAALTLEVIANLSKPQARSPDDRPQDLVYGTYLGAGNGDNASAIAVDVVGRATVAGSTWSAHFPTTVGAFDPSQNGSSDAFVARLSAGGDVLIYGTFLGGSAYDTGNALAVDSTGRATVTGWTQSSNFPATPGAFDTSFNGGTCSNYECADGFAVQLNADGSALVYSTFLGGSDQDMGTDIAADDAGRATVVGYTQSSDFPTTPNAFDTTLGGGDAFVTRLNADGSALEYGTFLGSADGDRASAVAVDDAGRATVVGETSGNFPTTPGAFDTTFNWDGNWICGGSPCPDAFVTRLAADGSALDYSTFLGAPAVDVANAVALNELGQAFVAGYSSRGGFPTTPGAFQTSCGFGWGDCGFVVRLNFDGSALVYSTFLDGYGFDTAYAIAVDDANRATVAGLTQSSDFPITPGAFDASHNGYNDAFVTRLNADGSALAYSTFFGGSERDAARAIAIDDSGRATLAGETYSSNMPTTPGALGPSYSGNVDAFVARLRLDDVVAPTPLPTSTPTYCERQHQRQLEPLRRRPPRPGRRRRRGRRRPPRPLRQARHQPPPPAQLPRAHPRHRRCCGTATCR